MCGIAGFVTEGGLGVGERSAALERMAGCLAHRGPDGEGFHCEGGAEGGVGLAHRRLAILDLSRDGAQPMVGPSGAVITFNGEIYNFEDLRRGLEQAGERFRSRCDTEVLLRLYEREGEACLDRLVGMFALAIWDPRRGQLFLARDRLGKKPLYYFHNDGLFAFASEPAALLALEDVRKHLKIDPRAVSDFLSLGYVLSPRTIFAGIHRLPAAHCAWYDGKRHTLTLREYWRLDEHVQAERRPSGPDTLAEFSALFTDAVQLRLRSDVPVGLYLSGGIDSAAIAATVANLGHSHTRAFCIGFDDPSYDESAKARRVADHLGIALDVLPAPVPTVDHLAMLISRLAEPFADTSMVPTDLLNRCARPHVTVALTGDGGDEILAGYPTYQADALYRWSRHLPGPVTRGLSWAAKRLLAPRYRKVGWDYRLHQFLAGHGLSRARAHYWWRVIFTEADKARLMSPELFEACRGYDPFDTFAEHFDRVRGAAFLDQTLYVDLKTWLQDDILVKADRMSMGHGVEVRSPFLDHRLVEFCATLPVSAKRRGCRQKAILKDAMAQMLPADILDSPKSGFSGPTRALGRAGLAPTVCPTLFRSGFVLDPTREDVTFKSFSLAALNTWVDLFGAAVLS